MVMTYMRITFKTHQRDDVTQHIRKGSNYSDVTHRFDFMYIDIYFHLDVPPYCYLIKVIQN